MKDKINMTHRYRDLTLDYSKSRPFVHKNAISTLFGDYCRKIAIFACKLRYNLIILVGLMMKKILMCTGIFPPDIGGPATMLGALAHELEQAGFQIKILTYSEKAGSEKNIIRVRKNGVFGKAVYFLRMFFLSFWSDVFYVTETYSVGYFAYIIKKITGRKYIIRFAGDSAWETAVANAWTQDYIVDFQHKTYDGKIETMKKRRNLILHNADRIITVSNFLADLLTQMGVKRDVIKVIYNSVEFINDTGRDLNECKNSGNGDKIITTICRLTPWKGVDGIIKIIPSIIKECGEVKFLILGDGPEMDRLKNLAKEMQVEDKVIFLGRVKHQDAMQCLKNSHLFVLNTNYEGLSHAILEAMHADIPVVSTNVGGNPETIEDAKEGLLVEYNNGGQLKDAIVKILSNPELAQTYTENAKSKLQKFNWGDNVKETINVINEIL